jgi:hypothetical protein
MLVAGKTTVIAGVLNVAQQLCVDICPRKGFYLVRNSNSDNLWLYFFVSFILGIVNFR